MKTLYLVRHGESEGNARVGDRYLGRESPLTPRGVEQAKIIAERAAHLPFEILISSPWVRALQTAQEIEKRTGTPIEISELFTERRAPSSTIGMLLQDPLFIDKITKWNACVFSETNHFEDGENFADLKRRAREALEYVRLRSEDRILVATHGLFLRMLMAYILIGESITGEQFRHFLASSKTTNTGVSIFTYGSFLDHEIDASERWRVRVFNDHAHLADSSHLQSGTVS